MTPLSQVLGHRQVLNTLVAANASGTVHHALLFAGPLGVGKATVARAFSALVNCTGQGPRDPNGQPLDACGVCRSCRRMLAEPGEPGSHESVHPDLLHLQPDGKAIKIDQVREILKVVPYPPLEARVRFVVIDPAESMTVPAANALLKTLEEPPSSTQFILISAQPDALLSTIRSRCQRISFGRLTDTEVMEGLGRHSEAKGETASTMTSMADGSLGGALALLNDPVLKEQEPLIIALADLHNQSTRAAMELAAELANQQEALSTIFDVMQRLYRDALLVRSGAGEHIRLTYPHLRQGPVQELALHYGVDGLLHRLTIIDETRRAVRGRHLPTLLSLERLLLALGAPPGREQVRTGLI